MLFYAFCNKTRLDADQEQAEFILQTNTKHNPTQVNQNRVKHMTNRYKVYQG